MTKERVRSSEERKAEQSRRESENQAFHEWFKARGYPSYPELYSLTTENAMHAAWQEAAKRATLSALTPEGGAGTHSPVQHVTGGADAAIRKAGQVAIDDLIERGGFENASDDDLADYLTRIVDACAHAALKSEGAEACAGEHQEVLDAIQSHNSGEEE